MRPFLILVLPLALTACATPREQCLQSVTRDLRINESLMAQTQANITRGFGLRSEQRVREVRRTCRGVTESGEAVRTRCDDVIVRNVNVPVAIDLNAERAKLASLRDTNATLRRNTAAAQQQCAALHPE